jgi:hypothetical protein
MGDGFPRAQLPDENKERSSTRSATRRSAERELFVRQAF